MLAHIGAVQDYAANAGRPPDALRSPPSPRAIPSATPRVPPRICIRRRNAEIVGQVLGDFPARLPVGGFLENESDDFRLGQLAACGYWLLRHCEAGLAVLANLAIAIW